MIAGETFSPMSAHRRPVGLSGVSCKCPVCMAHISHSFFRANLSSHCGAFNFGACKFHSGVRTWALFTCSPNRSDSLATGKVFLFTLQMHICFPSNFVMKLIPLNSGNFSNTLGCCNEDFSLWWVNLGPSARELIYVNNQNHLN